MKTYNLIFFLLTIVFLSGCSDTSDKSNLIAEFNGGSLTTEDLDARYLQMKKSRQFRNRPEQLTPEFVFEHALNMEMLIAHGLNEKLHQDPRIRAQIHEFMSNLFLKVMQDHLISPIDKSQFTEEELKNFFQDHRQNYITKPIYTVQMIKAESRSDAESALEFIGNRPDRFEEAARQFSVDAKSSKKGGSIGSRSLSKFRGNWQPVIAALETEKISGPHRLGEHYYIFQLVNKTDPVEHSFEDKKAYIKNDLLYAKYREAWKKTYKELKEKYEVSVHQENLTDFIKRRSDSQGESR